MKKQSLILKIILLGMIIVAGVDLVNAQTITNDVFWKDTDGNFIYSQGGGGIWVGDTYYWYGVKYNGAVTYAENPTAKNGDIGFAGITCYSSKDLVNWKNEGLALAPNQTGGGWIGRFGVAYNAKTKKYVLAGQGSGPSGGYGEYFATSSTPDGDFKFASVQTDLNFFVNGGTGDQTVFQDDDGKAYIICSNVSGRSNLYVAPLRESDFLAIEPTPTRIYRGSGREGNAMFKQNGTYYFCSSDLHGWNTSQTYCVSSKNILGPYSAEFVLEGTAADYSHVTQTGFFIQVKGSEGSFVINAGDRWSDFAGNGLGFNQWLPISFEKGTPLFNSLSQWNINVEKGTWSVGAANNYALNPTFEADRITVSQLTGWKVEPVAGDINSTSSRRTGRFGLNLTGSKTVSQSVNLPNGTYTLSAWVKSSGGQPSSTLFAKGFGGADKSASLSAPMAIWTKMSVDGIAVTNGTMVIGVQTNGSTSHWINLDDFELTRTGKSYDIQVSSSPGGVIEQSPIGASLPEGAKIVFTAVPLDGWQFSGWVEDHTGVDDEYVVTSLSGPISLNARFKFVGTDSINYEGENTKRSNAVIESVHSGFSGAGYANFDNVIGSKIEFSVVVSEAGEKTMKISYSNGSTSDRPVSISVNGTTALQSLGFPPTADWDSWSTKDVLLTLKAGVNTITFSSVSEDGGANIDKVEIRNKLTTVSIPSSLDPTFAVFDPNQYSITVQAMEFQVQIYSFAGKMVLDQKIKNESIANPFKLPVSEMQKGVYLLKISSGAHSTPIVFKLVKQ